jgi:hypothetical protein
MYDHGHHQVGGDNFWKIIKYSGGSQLYKEAIANSRWERKI